MELTPSPLDQPVALRSGDPHVCLANTRHLVLLDLARIIPARNSTRSGSLVRWLVPWPVRFRVQQVGEQLTVGYELDHGEQRQRIWQ